MRTSLIPVNIPKGMGSARTLYAYTSVRLLRLPRERGRREAVIHPLLAGRSILVILGSRKCSDPCSTQVQARGSDALAFATCTHAARRPAVKTTATRLAGKRLDASAKPDVDQTESRTNRPSKPEIAPKSGVERSKTAKLTQGP